MSRILFVDDEPRVLRGLQNALRQQRQCWQMVFVNSGEEALTALTDAPFDVLVTDMRMPGMDGVALLRKVNSDYPAMRCIVLSGYAEFAAREEAQSMAFRFLLKPCDTGTLRDAIGSALNQSSDGAILAEGA